jgi:hypothetical protein
MRVMGKKIGRDLWLLKYVEECTACLCPSLSLCVPCNYVCSVCVCSCVSSCMYNCERRGSLSLFIPLTLPAPLRFFQQPKRETADDYGLSGEPFGPSPLRFVLSSSTRGALLTSTTPTSLPATSAASAAAAAAAAPSAASNWGVADDIGMLLANASSAAAAYPRSHHAASASAARPQVHSLGASAAAQPVRDGAAAGRATETPSSVADSHRSNANPPNAFLPESTQRCAVGDLG